jgi:hypothetical protein
MNVAQTVKTVSLRDRVEITEKLFEMVIAVKIRIALMHSDYS